MQVTTVTDTLWVYLALTGVNDDQTTGTELWRARLPNKALTDVTQLYAMLLTTTSERQGRAIDKDQGASMEVKKQQGYF